MAVADGRAMQVSAGGGDVAPDIASSVNRLAAELRKAKEDILRSESREVSHMERMASIGEVAAIVAHEIKNPLAGISGALQVMAEDIPDNSPGKEICNEILSEIDRLDRTVKDLIAYAKPQEINLLLSDLNAVVDRAVRAISPAAQLKHISVGLHAGTIPDIMVDPERMEKVVSDILLYQCTLMPDGGQIEVSTVLDQERDEIGIFSTDTGQAMTGDRIRGIFKPSFSTRHSTAGLSLAIGRNIVESHGGRVRVESGFGIGNTFHIIIPVKG
jgi:signal transduction histidine kinase